LCITGYILGDSVFVGLAVLKKFIYVKIIQFTKIKMYFLW
jgi:hypothetical protein